MRPSAGGGHPDVVRPGRGRRNVPFPPPGRGSGEGRSRRDRWRLAGLAAPGSAGPAAAGRAVVAVGAAWAVEQGHGSPPFGRWAGIDAVGGAPPGGRGRDRPGFRAGRERLGLEQPGELGFEAAEAVQFGPDLGEALPQEGLGVAAGAQALVGDLEQLADLPQPQPGPLGPFDQPQAGDRVLVVQAVAADRAGGGSSPTRS